jgi:uncharacterized protein
VRALLDTNVLVSGILGRHRLESVPGELIRRFSEGEFELVVSDILLDEVERTLSKAYFSSRLTQADRDAEISILRKRADLVRIKVHVHGVASHSEDDLILATGLSAGADVLVTGDKELQSLGQVRGLHILTPRDFLDLLDAQDGETTNS